MTIHSSTTLATEAMQFALQAHASQVRKYTGEPYAVHLAEVAGLVAAVDARTELIAAAWLHDVIEDTAVDEAEIRERFGTTIGDLVVGLTDVSRPDDGNRAVRKALDRDHLAGSGPDVHTVKLADLISNAWSIATHDRGFARVYLQEKKALLDVLVEGHPALMAQAQSVWQRAAAGVGLVAPEV